MSETIKVWESEPTMATYCIFCGEQVIIEGRMPSLIVCDKCRDAVMAMREQMEAKRVFGKKNLLPDMEMSEYKRGVEDAAKDYRKAVKEYYREEQKKRDEYYRKGLDDGFLDGWKDCADKWYGIDTDWEATNGKVIKLLFPHEEYLEGNIKSSMGEDWWNEPYRREKA